MAMPLVNAAVMNHHLPDLTSEKFSLRSVIPSTRTTSLSPEPPANIGSIHPSPGSIHTWPDLSISGLIPPSTTEDSHLRRFSTPRFHLGLLSTHLRLQILQCFDVLEKHKTGALVPLLTESGALAGSTSS
ncbi:hypothetical protein KSP39_PZI017205 [Platanthera zijinensis]|uniref:Uncharacterized protein n=1 Tax=Platanthera zijinensis TaxID=2320716 RepID=A0AAP0FZK5_9ASPA